MMPTLLVTLVALPVLLTPAQLALLARWEPRRQPTSSTVSTRTWTTPCSWTSRGHTAGAVIAR